jgi:CDP-diacylglycerol--glycerol-3-phosphate 3-phosphatidyltransferase
VATKSIVNVPNAISFCRLCAAPVMLYLIFTHNFAVFSWVLLGALISDIADGLIARIFHLHTDFGAKLDASADMATYICAVIGLIVFKMDFIQTHKIEIIAILGFYLIEKMKTFYHYRVPMNSFHTYMSKITAYFQGIFIMWLFLFGFNPFVFYMSMMWSIAANIEEMILSSILKENRSDVRGLYWIIQQKKIQ